MADTRRQLLDTIEHQAFDPIMRADPDDVPKGKRATLLDVQGATRSTQARYEKLSSAQAVYREYKDDLSSAAAKKTSRQIDSLGLPTLRSIKPQVERIAKGAHLRAT